MITIKAELTVDDFIKLHGQKENVCDFSREAVEKILEHINNKQKESGDPSSVSWEECFLYSSEMDALGLIYECKNELSFHADEIVDMARKLDIGGNGENTILNDYLHTEDCLISNKVLLGDLMMDLKRYPVFFQAMAGILSNRLDFIELDSGKFLII